MSSFKSTFLLVLMQLISMLECMPSSVKMPSSCQDKNYCFERSPEYPQDELEAIFSDLHMKAINEPMTAVKVEDRLSDQSVCRSHKTLKPIYEIIDEEDNVRFVAQIDNKFIQKFTITECVHKGRIVNDNIVFTKTLLESFNVACVETMISPKFLVITHDKKNVELVSVKEGIPMGCVCRYDTNI